MAETKYSRIDNPGEVANPVSKLFLWWMTKIIKLGYGKDLSQSDLYPPRSSDYSQILGDKLEVAWKEEQRISKANFRKPSLLWALVKVFKSAYLYWVLWVELELLVIRMAIPLAIGGLLSQYNPKKAMDTSDAKLYAVIVLFLSFLVVIMKAQNFLGMQVIGMQARVACCSLLYRKVLKMNRHSLSKTATGQIVNLMSNDVNRFDMVPQFLHYLWSAPIQVPIVTYFMWKDVGYSAFAGILLVILQTYVTQAIITGYCAKLRGPIAKRTDSRVKLMHELTTGIQVIKMYAWEVPFEKTIKQARSLEMKLIRKAAYLQGISSTIMISMERLSLFATLITFLLAGGGLRADIVYTIAQYCNLLQLTCSVYFPMALLAFGEAKVSIKRIEDFLEHTELSQVSADSQKPVRSKEINANSETKKLTIDNVSASWSHDTKTNILNNISLEIGQGDFYAIVGPLGAGKSSLLQLLIGELKPSQGTVDLKGLKISYAAQEPWLFVGTIKENILFGEKYNAERYNKVIDCCALLKDFEQFPKGGDTLVGERGVSLSGGQRARVGLARAVYRKADLYLLDDPLSAVDAYVGVHLVTKCIEEFLSTKMRILVTHQLHHLKNADKIVVLNNGQIENQGTFEEMSKTVLFSELKSDQNKMEEAVLNNVIQAKNNESLKLTAVITKLNGNKHQLTAKETHQDKENKSEKTEESIGKGRLSSQVIKRYIRAGGTLKLIYTFLFVAIGTQLIFGAAELWLTYWTNQEELRTFNHSVTASPADTNTFTYDTKQNISSTFVAASNISEVTAPISLIEKYLKTSNSTTITTLYKPTFSTEASIVIWMSILVIAVGCLLARSLLFVKISTTASINLHNEMFGNVLHATMTFFDQNPSGRILNRFTKDMGMVDEMLPTSIVRMLHGVIFFLVISMLVVIVNPYMLITSLIIGASLYFLTMLYLKTGQNLKRLEGVTRSPVFSQVSSTLEGLSTIRASNFQELVLKQFDELQDVHTSAWYLTLTSSAVFGLWISFICWVFLSAVISLLVFFNIGSVHSGQIGMSITQSLILVAQMQHGIQFITDAITQMTCVERVLQYTDLPQERPLESLPNTRPAKEWPEKGRIVFQDLSARYYYGGESALRNINIIVENGWKVGIVGRTGAGKSSLISALFRLILVEGKISIDDIDTRAIGLKDLRRKISIIPQNPVLFAATLRYNLDPFNRHSDAAIWRALDDVELKESVASLAQAVSEGGSNFSAGQRQLICLARAVLNDNTILVLDEATANVDPQTDALIQETIKRRFASCTVLTVAHRVHTVAASDRILVMDNGAVVEYDHPNTLLQNPDGAFTKMICQLGAAAESGIREIARIAYDKHIKYADDDHKD